MPPTESNVPETRLLPQGTSAPHNIVAISVSPAEAASPSVDSLQTTIKPTVKIRQLSELPRVELDHLASALGLVPDDYKARQQMVRAIHERRQQVAAMDLNTMLEVIRWGRRPVPEDISKEQLAQEIIRITSMNFEGLSQPGLQIVAQLRNVRFSPSDDVPVLLIKLKKKESLFAKINRKRRSMLGSIVSNLLGENPGTGDDAILPNADSAINESATSAASAHAATSARPNPSAKSGSSSIKKEIEEAGLIGGIAGRIKRSADEYLNQKLDEIESRIDRKLDEIDRRLSEWRDKEIANRIRILKITLWASVVVGIVSLIYSYAKETFHPTVPIVAPPVKVIENPPTTQLK